MSMGIMHFAFENMEQEREREIKEESGEQENDETFDKLALLCAERKNGKKYE